MIEQEEEKVDHRRKKRAYADDEEAIRQGARIEPVSYEENQQLLRAFGGQAPQAAQPVH